MFRRDFIERHPEEVERVVRAYMKRLRFESRRSDQDAVLLTHPGDQLGLQMGFRLQGAQTPVFDDPPLVRQALLEEMQELLFKYHFIERKVDLRDFIDNSVVERVMNTL